MTDHTYYMQCIHQQVGYNQPTNVGYYLGADNENDQVIWAAAAKVESDRLAARDGSLTRVLPVQLAVTKNDSWFNLMGQQVDVPFRGGVYIHQGKKVFVK